MQLYELLYSPDLISSIENHTRNNLYTSTTYHIDLSRVKEDIEFSESFMPDMSAAWIGMAIRDDYSIQFNETEKICYILENVLQSDHLVKIAIAKLMSYIIKTQLSSIKIRSLITCKLSQR